MTIETNFVQDKDEVEVMVRFTGSELGGTDAQSIIMMRVIDKVSEAIKDKVLEHFMKDLNLDGEDPSRCGGYRAIRSSIQERIVAAGEIQFTQEVLSKVDIQALVNSTFVSLISRIAEKPTQGRY